MSRVYSDVFYIRKDLTRLEEVAPLQFRCGLPKHNLALLYHSKCEALTKDVINFKVFPKVFLSVKCAVPIENGQDCFALWILSEQDAHVSPRSFRNDAATDASSWSLLLLSWNLRIISLLNVLKFRTLRIYIIAQSMYERVKTARILVSRVRVKWN